jgi:hypothetical protein
MQENRKERSVGDALEFTYEVFKAIADAVMAKGGNMQHLRRIVNDKGISFGIAQLLVSDGVDIRRLLEGEYEVPVGYAMPRTKEELEAEFRKDGVSEFFYGKYRWQLHPSCAEITMRNQHRAQTWGQIDLGGEREAIISGMSYLGYRPAIHLELYAFAKANPELQRHICIFALGSFVEDGSLCFSAELNGGAGGRWLNAREVTGGRRWGSLDRFLFVRKHQ